MGVPTAASTRCSIRMCPREQHPAPMPSAMGGQTTGAAGTVGHRGWGHCFHHCSLLYGLGSKKQRSPCPSTGRWRDVFSLSSLAPCLVLSGDFHSLSQHSLNGLCETARQMHSILIPYLSHSAEIIYLLISSCGQR